MSRSLRLLSRTRPPLTNASARTPSHLISYAQRSSAVGAAAPSRAIIGAIDSGSGSQSGSSGGSIRWIIQSSPRVRNRT